MCLHGCASGLQDCKGRQWHKLFNGDVPDTTNMVNAWEDLSQEDSSIIHKLASSALCSSPQLCDVIQKVAKELANNTENGIFPVFDSGVLVESKKVEAFPLNDAEKKNAEKLLSKLHLRTGHPSNTALAGTLRHRGAHPEVIEMAKRH